MRFIDLDSHSPDEDEQLKKAEWLKKSKQLTKKLIELHEKGDIEGRNKFIEANKQHWGKIKEWLLLLSHGKCWFSEAKDIFSHMDVEHFRPKLEVKYIDPNNGETIKQGGYWWLAFDYHNFRACGNVGNRKKGGWFPLKQGSLISQYDFQCEESETNVLLDPTDPDDVELIAFNEEGMAMPAPGITDWEIERVKMTIKRLKLNEHAPLSEERRVVWQRMTLEIQQYKRFKERCGKGLNPGAKIKVKEHARTIKEMTRESAELSSVAKWCVLFNNEPALTRLIS
ncbi:MAG: hypothetical protein AAF639_42115 [Chloroflexota bacterium]